MNLIGTISILCASVLWGAAHSILASHAVKDAIRRTLSQPAFDKWYRFLYNAFALFSFLAMMAMLYSFPDQFIYRIPAPWVYLTVLIQVFSVIALIAVVIQTGPLEFIGLAQLMKVEESKPRRLMTSGFYAYVRHPLYTGTLVFLWLIPEMTINRLIFFAALTLYILIGAYFEERKLLKDFGTAYADYKAKTPMLVPKIW